VRLAKLGIRRNINFLASCLLFFAVSLSNNDWHLHMQRVESKAKFKTCKKMYENFENIRNISEKKIFQKILKILKKIKHDSKYSASNFWTF
jgi:hypothetical protein